MVGVLLGAVGIGLLLGYALLARYGVRASMGLLLLVGLASNTLFQRLVPAGMLGRVFGNFYGLIGVAAAVSYVGGGLLLDATSAPVTFLIAGAGGTLATIVVALTLPGALRSSTTVEGAGR